MHIENLKVFCDLVQSKSFSKAAKLNDITQSAVSQQLRSMEKHFNTLIIDRTQKQFNLTREGKSLYKGFKEIMKQYDSLHSEIQEMKKVLSGSIQISTVYSIGMHSLQNFLKTFMKAFPSVNIRVEYRHAALIYEDVLQGAADMGLVAYPEKQTGLEITPYAEERIVLATSVDHPLARHTTINMKELNGLNSIAFSEGIPTRVHLSEILEKEDIDMPVVQEFDNIETIKGAVEINMGVALLPDKTIEREVRQGTLKKITIKDRELVRPLAIIRKKDRVTQPGLKQFLRFLTSGSLEPISEEEKED